ncbi:cupin domain-containing protein [Candidatus Bathyarchaeota archaeon]|nr:cupin domain-containing protein [Candidatus Bathyarchaeota archaeon]
MAVTDTEQIAFWEPHPGGQLKIIGNGKNMTLAYSRIQPGSEIPEHKHPHEQLGYCLEGEARYRIDKKTFDMKKGYSIIIPANMIHSAKIIGKQEFVSIEAFSPPRPDLVRGKFAPEKT